jgi:DNA-binding response OmpR family regulator
MTKWRVMTVDDSAAILTIIAAYLEDSEFDVVAAPRWSRANT